AMGQPLEPGSYYVAFYNESSTDPSTFTFSSKAIGSGMALAPQPLAFAGGTAATGNLPAREVAYYTVDIPAGTPSWRVSLAADSGESALYINQGTIPTSQTTSSPAASPFAGSLVRLNKDGDEHYTLMPPVGASVLPEGRYDLMVVSEGQNPVDYNRIGSGTSAATVTSHGEAPVHDLGSLPIGGQLQLAGGFDQGDLEFLQFEVPPGMPAFEVRLEGRVGNPLASLGWTAPSFPRGINASSGYGYYAGPYAVRADFTRTTLANPAAGSYRLVVMDPARLWPPPSLLAAGSYTLVVTSVIPPALNFSATQNGNGRSNTAGGILSDDERTFYEVEVPAMVDGVPVIGWRLEIPATAGEPEIRVRKGSLPDGTEQTGGSLTDWALRSLIVASPELEPGTWYVEVKGGGATEFDLISEALTLERGVWAMPIPGAPSPTPGLSAPVFGDTGFDEAGTSLPGDQGLDLENGRYHYYAIDIPQGNGGLLRAQLEAINGNPDLYLRHGWIPTIDHLSPPYGTPGYAAFDYLLNAATQTEYGNFVPFDGQTETRLQPGRWYLAVRAAGNTNARYRLRLSQGTIDDLTLDGGVANSQLLAAGDWRYYRVIIPEDAPSEWSVTYSQQQGDVDLTLRDTIPPGLSFYFGANSKGASLYERDWAADRKNPGIPGTYSLSTPGTYTFSPPAVRPGSVYYLGFKAISDAVFDVSSSVGPETIGVIPEIAFAGGSIDITIPPGEHRYYKVVAPPNALRWSHTSTRSSNIEVRIEQGSVPALTGTADYTSSQTNGYFARDFWAYWPWTPDQTYYLAFLNHGTGPEPLRFAMQGEAGSTYAQWAADNGLSQDPSLAGQDNNGNGITDLFEYALVADGGTPLSALPQAIMTGDHLALRFVLPAVPLGDVTLSIDASPDLVPGTWQQIATKSANGAWTGSATVNQTLLGDQTTEVIVEFPASFSGQPGGFLRLRVILD
ncbi:MAG: hypothetical protein K9M97_08465, partial [Akkermansiaceae bacterium]|nr:hypothetical protein [Akkermansiaceae bacterium]